MKEIDDHLDLIERIKELEEAFVYGDATQTHLNLVSLIPKPEDIWTEEWVEKWRHKDSVQKGKQFNLEDEVKRLEGELQRIIVVAPRAGEDVSFLIAKEALENK